MKRVVTLTALAGLMLAGLAVRAEDEPKKLIGVAYGKHERQVLDFYQAKSDKPTPVVFHIHGGGWQGGDKKGINPKPFLDKGISVVSINYRYTWQGPAEENYRKILGMLLEGKQITLNNIDPPVKAPLRDAARALQFVRSKAKEWNIDKERIGATGGSAGGCSSLWLAFHDDMADKDSKDPVARESTRLYCAAVNGAQTTLDPKILREWMPNYSYGAHAFGMKNLDEVEKNREKLADWIKEYSPMSHISKDDPPVGLFFSGDKDSKKGDKPKDATHSPILGLLLEEKLKEAKIDYVIVYPGRTSEKYKNATEYLIDKLSK